MIRGTTPTFTLTIDDENLDLSQAENVYVTIKQANTTITKTGEYLEVDQNMVMCWLTEEESFRLKENIEAAIQINWTYLESSGTRKRAATQTHKIMVGRQLLNEEIT